MARALVPFEMVLRIARKYGASSASGTKLPC